MTNTGQHILNTLAYYDIFHYPLLKEEIHRFHGQVIEQSAINESLNRLTAEQTIFSIDGFYALHNDGSMATKRRIGNRLAAKQMTIAQRSAKLLSWFPYVRGLAISGSLSKNYCNEKTDIDFFIITAPGRLWIARTLMHLYKKFTFLTGRQKWFCMNYFVDEACLEIEEKNIFTAMEITTLLPMYGKTALHNFTFSNKWIKNYLPGDSSDFSHVPELKKGMFCKLTEFVFNNQMGNWLDDQLMWITQKRWQKKEQRKMKNDNGYQMGMVVNKHFSKPNPVYFQDKVLEMYRSRLEKLPNNSDAAVTAL